MSSIEPPVAGTAPIALFVYARPEHATRTIQSLKRNDLAADSELFVFCDGPRSAAVVPAAAAVREAARHLCATGFKAVHMIEREHNLGLARSIVAGVGSICRSHGRVIVVEDDLLLSPHFLRYMNDGLNAYAGDEGVASIHGYCYPLDISLPETFFLRGADCWGWATWARAWRHFEPDGSVLLAQLRERGLTHAFDLDGAHGFTRMLENQIAGRNDSWAIRWHAACFLREMVTLYPGTSLVENIGNDSSGTHASTTRIFTPRLAERPLHVARLAPVPDEAARQAFARFFRRHRRQRLTRWIAGVARRLGAR